MDHARLSVILITTVLAPILMSCGRSGENQKDWEGATILVSIDGFRWDYREFADTPALDRLAARGVVASLRPSFPSKTFPSHHSIATGLHPNHHGVVGNTMYDPLMDGHFSMGDDESVRDGRWWGGEPIWVTAEKSGLITATYFWPGSEAEIDGVRPTHWKKYDDDVPPMERVDQILEWLALPTGSRPSFFTLYFSDVDGAGHAFGPESEETARAIQEVDGYIAELVSGIHSLGLSDRVNVVVTSDHGMAQLSRDRVVVVDDYIDLQRARPLSLGQYMALWPEPDDEEEIYLALKGAHPSLSVYRRGEIPDDLHLDGNSRTPPIVGIVEPGWSASTRSWVERPSDPFRGGGHGYEPTTPDMAGIFIASGPAFNTGKMVATLDAVDVYNLLAASLRISPARNDGNAGIVPEIVNAER